MGLYHFKGRRRQKYIEQGLFAVLYDDANSPMNKLDFALLVCLFVAVVAIVDVVVRLSFMQRRIKATAFSNRLQRSTRPRHL